MVATAVGSGQWGFKVVAVAVGSGWGGEGLTAAMSAMDAVCFEASLCKTILILAFSAATLPSSLSLAAAAAAAAGTESSVGEEAGADTCMALFAGDGTESSVGEDAGADTCMALFAAYAAAWAALEATCRQLRPKHTCGRQ